MRAETVKQRLNSIIDAAYFLLNCLPDDGEVTESMASTLKVYNDEILSNAGFIAYVIGRAEGWIDDPDKQ